MENENDNIGIETLVDEEEFDEIYDNVTTALHEELEAERVRHREIQFIFLVVIVILFNSIIFPSMESFGGPVVIGILEAIALLLIARALGLRQVSRILNKLIARVTPGSKN